MDYLLMPNGKTASMLRVLRTCHTRTTFVTSFVFLSMSTGRIHSANCPSEVPCEKNVYDSLVFFRLSTRVLWVGRSLETILSHIVFTFLTGSVNSFRTDPFQIKFNAFQNKMTGSWISTLDLDQVLVLEQVLVLQVRGHFFVCFCLGAGSAVHSGMTMEDKANLPTIKKIGGLRGQ